MAQFYTGAWPLFAPGLTTDIDRPGVLATFSVETCRFEDICAEFAPTALVVDIEGGEYDLITRAGSFGSIVKIILELHPDDIGKDKVDAILAHLESAGFWVADSLKNGEVIALLRDHPDRSTP